MKTYIVTKKHPDLKKGIQIKNNHYSYFIGYDNISFAISEDIINNWLKKGYIKEIQKLEFTKDDMINFAAHCVRKYQKNKTVVMIEEFNKW